MADEAPLSVDYLCGDVLFWVGHVFYGGAVDGVNGVLFDGAGAPGFKDFDFQVGVYFEPRGFGVEKELCFESSPCLKAGDS